ncbi:MAG: threonine--tRNA ligase [Pseudopedobacter saltans]|uniref:Threonine--tRNA ligase n=1 Tax=Pseudopedobacter saltans TaxID=151895 RepID=A0A2W5F117_9SPHI|nr:MAG: threonine--tRNA ligase [Pseudopedobacter saltans]
MIKITFPDGAVREYESGVSALDIAKSISEGLARKVLAAEVDGKVIDSFKPLTTDASVKFLTWDDLGGKSTFWHSSAHLLAEALEALFPGTKFGIGPAIEKGFYYDIDLGDRQLSEEDLGRLEKKMKELAAQKEVFIRKDVSKKDALEYFKEKDDQYKLELIDGLEDGNISFYTQGNFTDLCRGPHIPNTGFIKAIKLTNIAGAYWRGNEKNKMLTRIYGVTFPSQKELEEYLTLLEEAKKRDHRKIGKELELFTFSEKVGPGLPLWLPKGTLLRNKLQDFLQKELLARGYQPVMTPHIGSKQLYVTSGHWAKYGADSFRPITTPQEGEEYMLKPMNCPHHCEIYKSAPRSYKDLPLRFSEFGTVYRYEQSGELHGLTRVRSFTQDDAHIFVKPDQVLEEFKRNIELVTFVFNALDFKDFTAQISVRDLTNKEKYIGSEENWEIAENAIRQAAKEYGLPTIEKAGEAAFYGPKLDFMVKDAIGRSWQLGTIQVDYNLPERFELEYVDSDNTKKRPVMLHRAPFGSMERFIAVLLESCAGNLPLWLAPVQVTVLPITDKYNNYAEEVAIALRKVDVTVNVDDRNEKIGRKIRDTELKKVPYMLVVGEKEMTENKVAIRFHGQGDQGSMDLSDFIQKITKEILEKK